MARVTTKAPHNVRCSYSGRQLVTKVGSRKQKTENTVKIFHYCIVPLKDRMRCKIGQHNSVLVTGLVKVSFI